MELSRPAEMPGGLLGTDRHDGIWYIPASLYVFILAIIINDY